MSLVKMSRIFTLAYKVKNDMASVKQFQSRTSFYNQSLLLTKQIGEFAPENSHPKINFSNVFQ